MERLHCGFCKKPLGTKTEIEYSEEMTEFYCDPSCATSAYFDHMRSKPFDVEKDGIVNFEKYILFVDYKGRLFRKD
jgi:hypothetical protein